MAVRRALNEKKLRAELEEARKGLRHSQSLYHALVDIPPMEYSGVMLKESFSTSTRPW